jgi:hypothetical protein
VPGELATAIVDPQCYRATLGAAVPLGIPGSGRSPEQPDANPLREPPVDLLLHPGAPSEDASGGVLVLGGRSGASAVEKLTGIRNYTRV